MIADYLSSFVAALGLVNFAALIFVAAIGLPHGAFDAAIAIHLGYARRMTSFVGFLILYTLMAVLVVMVWLALPALSLIIFLIISMLHFGIGDARAQSGRMRYVQAVAHGGNLITGISHFHRAETDQIYGYLVGDTSLVWTAINGLTLVVAGCVLICIWHAIKRGKGLNGLGEMAGLLLLYYLLPPLLGFAVYFCLVHSARHLATVWHALSRRFNRRRLAIHATGFTLASWLAGALVIGYSADILGLEAAIMRTVFIGLAALTVPHMLLVDGVFRRREKR